MPVEVFERTFTRLHGRGVPLRILHPAVQVSSDADLRRAHEGWKQLVSPELATFLANGSVFLSINRFERKKVGAQKPKLDLNPTITIHK